MNEINLVEELPNVYDDIKPSLLRTAYNYNVPNPEQFVDEWFTSAYMIVRKMDLGDLDTKVIKENSDGTDYDLVDYDKNKHTLKEVLKSTKAYLRKSFRNDLIKNYKSRKKFQDYVQNAKAGVIQASSSLDGIMETTPVYLEDFLELLELDLKRLSSDSESAINAKVNYLFIYSMAKYCKSVFDELGNIAVVSDIEEQENKKFFIREFKSDLEAGARLHLANFVLQETNPVVVARLASLVNPDKKGTIQKKMTRYLFEYHNGFPKRLRDRLNE